MLISVVIPSYNSVATVDRCIKSVLAQTYPDVEVLVIDDGSSDDTGEFIAASDVSSDRRLRYIKQEHGGVSIARNRGIAEARGKYVAFLDADDSWLPNKLELFLPHLKDAESLVYSDAYIVTAGKRTKLYSEKVQPHEGHVLPQLFATNFVCASTVVVQRSLLLRTGLFACLLSSCEDYLLWLKLAKYTEFCYVAAPLTVYAEHKRGISGIHWAGNYLRLVAIKMMLMDLYPGGFRSLLCQIACGILSLPKIAVGLLQPRDPTQRRPPCAQTSQKPAGRTPGVDR